MALKLDELYGGAPMTALISGRFTCPTQLNTANQQVLPAAISYNQTPNVFNLGTFATVQPQGAKVTIFANPVSGTSPAAANISSLPRGLPPTVTTVLSSEYVVDMSGFAGEIMFAHAHIVSNQRGARNLDALVSIVDQSNMNIYIQVVSYSTGSPAPLTANFSVAFQVGIKDSIGV